MRQRSVIEESKKSEISTEYHTGVDEAITRAEEMRAALEDTKARFSPELAEKLDQLFETEDEREQEAILSEIIAQCPVKEQITMCEKLIEPIAEIERAVEAGEIPQQKIASLFRKVLFADAQLQEKEIDPLGNSSVLMDVLKGFSRTLLEAAVPKAAIVALLGAAIAPEVAAQTFSATFFSGVATGQADPCGIFGGNCAAGYWQDMDKDVLGTLKRVVRATNSNVSSSVISGQKLCLSAEKAASAANLEFSAAGAQCARTVIGPIYNGAQATITINAAKVTADSCANVEQSLSALMDDCADLGSSLKGAAKNAVIACSVVGGAILIVGTYLVIRYALKKCNEKANTATPPVDRAGTTVEMPRIGV